MAKEPEDTLSVAAVAEQLGISRWSVWRMIAEGELEVEQATRGRKVYTRVLLPLPEPRAENAAPTPRSRTARLQDRVDRLTHTVEYLSAMLFEAERERTELREIAEKQPVTPGDHRSGFELPDSAGRQAVQPSHASQPAQHVRPYDLQSVTPARTAPPVEQAHADTPPIEPVERSSEQAHPAPDTLAEVGLARTAASGAAPAEHLAGGSRVRESEMVRTAFDPIPSGITSRLNPMTAPSSVVGHFQGSDVAEDPFAQVRQLFKQHERQRPWWQRGPVGRD